MFAWAGRPILRGVSGHDHSEGGDGHSHGFGAHALEARREDSRRRLEVVLAINLVLLVAEAVGGFITGSLAVLRGARDLVSPGGAGGPPRRRARAPRRRRDRPGADRRAARGAPRLQPAHLRLPALRGV